MVRRGTLRVGPLSALGHSNWACPQHVRLGNRKQRAVEVLGCIGRRKRSRFGYAKHPGLPLDIRQHTDGLYDRVKQVTAHEMRRAAVVGKCDFATGVQGRRPITQKALEFRECLLLWAIDV